MLSNCTASFPVQALVIYRLLLFHVDECYFLRSLVLGGDFFPFYISSQRGIQNIWTCAGEELIYFKDELIVCAGFMHAVHVF